MWADKRVVLMAELMVEQTAVETVAMMVVVMVES